MKKQTKNEIGITLVALVITIIILLILAGVGITALTQTELFEKANQSKNIMENAQNSENIILASYEKIINEMKSLSSSRDGEISNSNIIKKVMIDLKQEGSNLEINLKLDTSKSMENAIAALIVDSKLHKGYNLEDINNNNIQIENVKPNTEYNMYFIIVDENGDILKTENKKYKTSESEYTWKLLEYPLLTTSGMKNMKYSDQFGNIIEYKKDISQGNCTASDSLPKEAWDDNKSTYVTTGTYYFEISEDMIGKIFSWNQSPISYKTSGFWFLDSTKKEISEKFGWDVSGTIVVQENTKYIKYYTNGHKLYEIPNI